MPNYNQTKISKIIYSVISALMLIAFLVFILPVALILVTAIIFFVIIFGVIANFMINKKNVKMNFVYKNQQSQNEDDETEIHEIKDVTNSNDSSKD